MQLVGLRQQHEVNVMSAYLYDTQRSDCCEAQADTATGGKRGRPSRQIPPRLVKVVSNPAPDANARIEEVFFILYRHMNKESEAGSMTEMLDAAD